MIDFVINWEIYDVLPSHMPISCFFDTWILWNIWLLELLNGEWIWGDDSVLYSKCYIYRHNQPICALNLAPFLDRIAGIDCTLYTVYSDCTVYSTHCNRSTYPINRKKHELVTINTMNLLWSANSIQHNFLFEFYYW